jgi:hypothetical protein
MGGHGYSLVVAPRDQMRRAERRGGPMTSGSLMQADSIFVRIRLLNSQSFQLRPEPRVVLVDTVLHDG